MSLALGVLTTLGEIVEKKLGKEHWGFLLTTKMHGTHNASQVIFLYAFSVILLADCIRRTKVLDKKQSGLRVFFLCK